MSFELYQRVALKVDVPEHGLRAGDVATLVDIAPHPIPGKPRGCTLEVFNAIGESIAVVTVPETNIQSVSANDMLAIRPLRKAG